MTTHLTDRAMAVVHDRTWIGAGGGLIAIAACSMALASSSRPDAPTRDLADHAQLAVLVEPSHEVPIPALQGRMETLDPNAPVAAPAQPLDPELRAALIQERRLELAAAAEQRAFEAKLNADLAPIDMPAARTEPPASRGTTSNSEEAAETP